MKGFQSTSTTKTITAKIQLFLFLFAVVFGQAPLVTKAADAATTAWFQNFKDGNGFAPAAEVALEVSNDAANTMDSNSLKMNMKGTDTGNWDNNKNSAIITPMGQTTFDASKYNYFIFYVKDTSGTNNVHVTIKDVTGTTWDFGTDSKAVQNSWTKIVVTLDKTKALDWTKISEIRLGEYWNYNNVYYFDDLYFAQNTNDTPPGYTVPVPSTGETTWYQSFKAGNGFAPAAEVATEISNDAANTMDSNSLKMTMKGTDAGNWDNNKNSAIITPMGQTTFDASNYSYFMFYVKDTSGNNNVHVTIKDVNGATWDFGTSSNAVQNKWTKMVVALDKTKTLDWSKICEIRLGEYWNWSNVYYFDDLYFAKNASDTPPGYGDTTVPVTPISASDYLKAEGGFLWNQNGNKVALRGVNLGGWLLQESWMCPVNGADKGWANLDSINALKSRGFTDEQIQELFGTYQDNWVTTDDLDRLVDMGVNAVRVPFWYRNFMSDENGTWITNALNNNPGIKRLDWIIEEAGKRGIYVILDCHGAPGGQSLDHSTGTLGKNELYDSKKNRAIFVDLWTKIASRYKDNPVVASYDIMNEPQNNGQSDTANGWPAGSDEALQRTYSVYDELYKAIRAVDPNHVITMEAIWTGTCLPDPATYGWTNLMYQMHLYDTTKDMIDTRVNELIKFQTKYGVAAYAGEFNCDPNEEYAINKFNKAGISWTSWAYKGSKQTVGNNWFLYVAEKDYADTTVDSYETIKAKWGEAIQTKNFTTNTSTVYSWIKNHTSDPIPNSVFAPDFSPAGGTITAVTDVSITCATPGASIKYTTDGSDPKTSGTAVSGTSPINLKVVPNTTLRAYAFKADMDDSDTVSAAYILPKVSAPTFNPDTIGIPGKKNITITSTTVGANIKYTIDDSDPKTSSTAVSGPSPLTVEVVPNTTLKAYAYGENMTDSAVVSAYYPLLVPAKWYQNFETGTGFTAGAANAIVSLSSDSPLTEGSKSVQLVVRNSGDPGNANQCVNIAPQGGTPVDTTGLNYLVFYVKDTQGSNTVKITMIDKNNALWSGWSGGSNGSTVKNKWTKIILPLSSVSGIDKTAIKEIRLGQWNSGTYYFDDIFFAQTVNDANPFFTEAAEIASKITYINPPAKDAVKLTLPQVKEGFKISIKSTSNPDCIALDGTITPPIDETTVTLVFTVTNIDDGSSADTASINVVIPPKTQDATLSSITIDGKVFPAFDSAKTNYTIKIPVWAAHSVPKVEAAASKATSRLNITQAASVNDTATIEVTAEDGRTKLIYTIKFERGSSNDTSLKNIFVDGNPISNIVAAPQINFVTISYSAKLTNVTATAYDLYADVKIIQANPAKKTAVIMVIAPNKRDKQTYIVEFKIQ